MELVAGPTVACQTPAMKAEVVVDGVRFGEGPVWCPDGTLIVTSVADGVLHRVLPDEHRREVLARTGGGPNAAALDHDGTVLVTQNGGIDFRAFGMFDPPPPYEPVEPGLQRLTGDGGVEYVLRGGFLAPNDLVVAADGTVYFTDPPHHPPPPEPVGRVWALRPGAVEPELVADGFSYCNGIQLDPHGHPVVVEGPGLMRLLPDGSREWVIEDLGPGGGDGFCVDIDGRFYVAATATHGVRVIEDGKEVDFLEIPGGGLTTNCCFGGPDRRDLYATDALPGNVVVWKGLPTPGLPLPTPR